MNSVPTTETFDILAHAKQVERKQSYRRYAVMGAGLSLLLAASAAPRLAVRLLLTAVGTGLFVRGVTAHTLRENVRRLKKGVVGRKGRRLDERERDTVDEASWESFPASDPPSFASR